MLKTIINDLLIFVKKDRALDLTILLFLTLFIHRGWFTSGIISYGDWAYIVNREYMLAFFSLPHIWNAYHAGYYDLLSLSNYPIGAIASVFVKYFEWNNNLTNMLLYFLPYTILIVFSMYYLSHVIFKKRIICFFSSVLYAFNTGWILQVAGGQLTTAMGCALAPLIIAFFIKSFNENRFKYAVITGLLFATSIVYDLRFAYITLLIVLLYLAYHLLHKIRSIFSLNNFYDLEIKQIKKDILYPIALFFIILIVPVIIHAYWIMPMIFVKPLSLPIGCDQPLMVKALSFFSIYQAMYIINPDWIHTKFFNPLPLSPFIYFIPIIIFSSLIIYKKDKNVLFFAIVAIISIFLTKGSNPPFGDIYLWMFTNLPGFSAFRVPSKFFLPLILSYSVLFGVMIDAIIMKLGDITEKVKSIDNKLKIKKIIQGVVLFTFFLLYMSTISPAIINENYGTFNTHDIPKEYIILNNFLENQNDYFRIFWYPYTSVYKINNQKHPEIDKRVFSSFGKYFFEYAILNYETYRIDKILGLFNVRYVILDPNDKSSRSEQYLQALKYQQNFQKLNINKDIHIFKNNYIMQRLYTTPNAILVVGNRSILLDFAEYDMDFSNFAVFFIDDLQDNTLDIINNINIIVFKNKDLDDLVLATVDKKYHFDLRQYASLYSYPKENWIITFDNFWLNNNGEISQKGLINTKDILILNIYKDITTEGLYDIFIKAGFGQNSGNLITMIDYEDKFDIGKEISSEGLAFSSTEYPGLSASKAIDDDENSYWASSTGVFGSEDMPEWLEVDFKNNRSINRVQFTSAFNALADYKLQYYNGSDWKDIVSVKGNKMGSVTHVFNTINTQKVRLYIISTSDGSYARIQNFKIYEIHEDRDEIKSLNNSLKHYKNISSMRWKKINPTKYEVEMNTTNPTFIVFSETYDSLWVAKYDDKEVNSVIAYSAINSFPINKTGNVSITLEYTPQKYVYIGFIISLIGLFSIILYFVVSSKSINRFYSKVFKK